MILLKVTSRSCSMITASDYETNWPEHWFTVKRARFDDTSQERNATLILATLFLGRRTYRLTGSHDGNVKA